MRKPINEGVNIDSEKLKEALQRNPYPMNELAEILGVSNKFFSSSLTKKRMGEQTLIQLCRILRRDPKDFIIAEEEKRDESNNDNEVLVEIYKILKEDAEVRARSEAKLSEILLEIQKLGTRSSSFFKMWENYKKYGHG